MFDEPVAIKYQLAHLLRHRPGQVNITDFSLLAAAYGSTVGDPPPSRWDARTDFNESRQVNIRDFSLVAVNYGKLGEQHCN